MKSHEQKYSEAIEALTHRLATWGVPDADTKAREFIRDLTHHGWRGAVAELDRPRPVPAGDAATGAALVRAELEAARRAAGGAA